MRELKCRNSILASLSVLLLGSTAWVFQNCGGSSGSSGSASISSLGTSYEYWSITMTGTNSPGQCGGQFSENDTVNILYSGSLATAMVQGAAQNTPINVFGTGYFNGTEGVLAQSPSSGQTLLASVASNAGVNVQSYWNVQGSNQVVTIVLSSTTPLLQTRCHFSNGSEQDSPITDLVLTATTFNPSTLSGTWTMTGTNNSSNDIAGTFTMNLVAGGASGNAFPGPQSVQAIVGTQQASLNWAPYAGAASYNVYSSVGTSVSPSSAQASQAVPSGTSALISSLVDGSPYAFAVTAVINGVETPPSNVIWAVTGMPISTATQVTAGQNHACAIVDGGQVYCWGGNGAGQLGNGGTLLYSPPGAVQGLSGAVAISAGNAFTCAIISGGTVKCWGVGTSGQLGNGTNNTSSLPVTVTGISTAQSISSRGGHTCAVLTNNTVKCWGTGSHGELGSGLADSNVPVDAGVSGVTLVQAGLNSTCALTTSQAAECWGSGSPSAVAVSGISQAIALASGDFHSCAVSNSGGVKCWGLGTSGQLGNGSNASSATPVTVSSISSANNIVAGSAFSCATLGASAWCWGANESGELGDSALAPSPQAVQVTGLNNALPGQFAAGSNFACLVTNGGNIDCWGANDSGQLGNGVGAYSTSPLLVSQ